MFYIVINTGEIPQLPCGARSVIALPPGRKWITLVEWSTLEVIKLELSAWERMKPSLVTYNRRTVLRHMKNRLQYVTATENIKVAMALVKQQA